MRLTQSILKPIVNDNYVPSLLIIKSCWINLALSGFSVSLLCHTDASFLRSTDHDTFHMSFNQQCGISLCLQRLEMDSSSLLLS